MQYVPILILVAAGMTIGGAALLISHLLGPKIKNAMKDRPFECGVPPVGDAKGRIAVRFYLVAILFLLFDVEVVFFIPWSLVFREYLAVNTAIVWQMALFFVVLTVGLIYEYGKKALEWD